ncbi:hypothetical protein HB662_08755 [Roseomonas frigidaquae]|uniref:Uncharacterized protein n=1 Tax=Falsiroseomonas frigidaquae TaxID=487318 RepID=A0ABX1EXP8_9PROT|nr:hypothetical protein [Falsiroseomonas frigidaquae]NKE44866.1 hypothetical protein [Falsiroseomonas frigidaquae]
MPNHSDRADQKPVNDHERGVMDTFPASDPVSDTATQGPRAVPAGEDHPSKNVPDAVPLSRHFKDHEAAKLALEELVRSVPLDRSATELSGAELRLSVPRDDAKRIDAMLQKA